MRRPVLRRGHALAVRHVDVQHPHLAVGRGEDTALVVVEIWDILHDLVAFTLAQDRDTVVGALSRVQHPITRLFDLGGRKGLVDALGLLQGQYVRLGLRDPLQHVRQADLERILVPGGELHCVSAACDEYIKPRYHCGAARRRWAAHGRGIRRTTPSVRASRPVRAPCSGSADLCFVCCCFFLCWLCWRRLSCFL